MIRNSKEFQKFKEELIKKDKTDIQHKFHLLDSMYKEAVVLNVFPLKDPLEGLETDIKIAKVVNSVRESS